MGTSSPHDAAPAQLELFATPARPHRAPEPPPRQRQMPVGEHLTGTDLRRRGWTAAAASRFLGEPDAVVEKRRGGWLIRENRYSAARVAAIEAGEAFAAWAVERDRRRRAAEVGLERAVAEAAAWSPAVPRKGLQELRQLAADHYNERLFRRMERRQDFAGRPAELGSAPAFLDRISVNYLRHAATRYDELLDKLDRMGRRGSGLASTIRRRALEAIREAYPELAAECDRQIRGRAAPAP